MTTGLTAWALSVTFLASTFAVPACAPTRAGETPRQAGEAVVATSRSEPIRLPMDKYVLAPAEVRRLLLARSRAVGDCLRRFGLIYDLPVAVPPVSGNQRRYGPTDPVQVAEQGYHVEGLQPSPTAERLPRAVRAVLLGTTRSYNGKPVPEAGCLGEADRRSRGPRDAEIAIRISWQSYRQSLDHRSVKRLFQKWSACMRTHGHRYRTPVEAMNDPRFVPDKPPTPLERSTAKADLRCKERTNAFAVWSRAEAEIQQQLITENRNDLSRALREKVAKLVAADDIMNQRAVR